MIEELFYLVAAKRLISLDKLEAASVYPPPLVPPKGYIQGYIPYKKPPHRRTLQ